MKPSVEQHTSSHQQALLLSHQAIERPLTAQELAEIVPLHPVTLLRWARENKIPHRRLSARRIVFIPSQINHWLASEYSESVGHVAQPERTAT
ncbi:helix-turn-helix domain-containing protein [Terriglobus sp. TAA 43]|uniref:helix-turn-helix transcriptional regulator n=1 Tax=Terriglobus sp. TAA 43 TaxID=278961 RepID=UPI000A035C56